MNTLVERIQALMDATKWDVEEVARVAGVSASAVYQWLGHGTKTIHSIGKLEAALKLERASGFSALWLSKGSGPKMVGKPPAALASTTEPEARQITDSQWQLLQDFEMLIPEEQNAIRKTLKEKAEYARKVYEQITRRHSVPPPVPDRRIEETFGPRPDKKKQ